MSYGKLNSAASEVVNHGNIGPIWSHGCEIIRRIFVTVRDRNWQEVAPQQWDTEVDRVSGNISIRARHTSDLVDFAWRGELRIADVGREVTFSFTGRVPKDMDVCRLGLVVLHPVEWMVGSHLHAQDGQLKQSLEVPNVIAPQPILHGIPSAITQPFSEIRIEHRGFGRLDLQFKGDLFELEDQRNWGDSSFKTYCTPLRLGFPRSMKSGTTITHQVDVRFKPAREVVSASTARLEASTTAVPGSFPKIGREWSPLSADPNQLGSEPCWNHIQLLADGTDECASRMRPLLDANSPTPFDIAIRTKEPAQLRQTLLLLSKHRPRVQRFFLYSAEAAVPAPKDFKCFRREIEEFPALTDVPVLVATQGYFVEFNRAVPSNESYSGLAFPLTSTVHSDDVETIVDNVATIRDIADTTRKLLLGPLIAVAPLALYYPSNSPRQFPARLARPWLVALLIESAVVGVSSVTLANDVIAELKALPPERNEPSLSSLVDCSGFRVSRFDGALPPRTHAVVLESVDNSSCKILAANLSASPQLLTFRAGALHLSALGTVLADIDLQRSAT